jgi:hypothetical protein
MTTTTEGPTISIAEAMRRYGLTRDYVHALIEAGWSESSDSAPCMLTAMRTGKSWQVSVADLDRWADWYDAQRLSTAREHMERRATDWIQLEWYRLERDKASFDRLAAKGHFRYESIRCVDSGIHHDTYFRRPSHSDAAGMTRLK